ncbi:MAG: translation initiation factor IF-2 [Phycisphaerales bacterium]
MAKRVFELAKELGIDSKAIVAKCHAEGISKDSIKGHMSSISAGLEMTIREWFSEATHGTTAVENAAPVDLEKVRVAKSSRRKAAAKKADEVDAPESVESAVAVEDAPAAPKSRSRTKTTPISSDGAPEPHSQANADPKPELPKPEAPVEVVDPGTLAATKIMPTMPVSEPKAPETKAPEAKPAETTVRPAAVADKPATTPPPRDGGSAAPTPTRKTPSAPPAPMNVPRRPKVIAPAGPQLEVRSPVKLAGPKIVRVEAPEQIEAPRPRRAPAGPGGPSRGPRTGAGAGGPAFDDDSGRNSRRRGAGAGAGASGPNNKRSSGTGVPDKRRGRSGTDWVGSTQGIFSEQDLIEREVRLARAGGFVKKHKQDLRRPGQGMRDAGPKDTKVKIAAPFTIKDLSAATGVKAAEIVKKLFLQGVMATVNSGIDPVKAQEIMIDFNLELEVVEAKTAEEAVSAQYESRDSVDQRPRGPVVTILGHVDHGKTSLLDKIRNANVAAGEAGGITQRTSAFRVPLTVAGEQKEVVFLDTPGHEAFTSMRSRGANMTDVVVLVVSAPEGVMPQTIESISHAKAAGVPIVVALNKIDRPDATEAQIQKTLGQLAEHGLNPVDWGGDTEVVKTSATTGQGIPELLETLDYQAQLKELKADFGGHARGTVIEARTEEGRGTVASLLVQDGELSVGDFVVAGRGFGRIREILDDRGTRIKAATPPMPVLISGIDEVPDAGDKFYVVDSLKEAQEAADQRRQRERQARLAQPKVTLDSLFGQIADKDIKEILVVLKVAEQGTADVLKAECEKVKGDEVKVRVLHAAVGGITESDVVLADASKAIVIGFNVIPSGKARSVAEQKGVEIRTYQVIYEIVDDLRKAAEGLLTPELRQEILGHAEVRKVFKVTRVGNIAGCYVTDGTVQRDAFIRVTRNGVVIENDRKLAQLKRVKDDAKEVRAGMECGMKIDGYDDIKEGDVLECYKRVEVKRTL